MTATFTTNLAPCADQFRPGDFWRAPNGRLCVVHPMKSLPSHVCLRPVAGGPHTLLAAGSVLGFQRTKWGGAA